MHFKFISSFFVFLAVLGLSSCMSSSSDNRAAAVAASNVSPQESTNSLQVPAGKTLVFVGQATEPEVIRSMRDYVQNVGQTPAGFMFYLIFSGDLQRTKDDLATMQSFMDQYPGTALQLAVGYGPELTGNNKESVLLLAGHYDAELQALGEWLKALNRPAFVRPLYEFDRGCDTYGPPELYKPAYRYMVDHIRKYTRQVRFVWQSAGPGYEFDNYGTTAILGALSRQFGGQLDPAVQMNESLPYIGFCPIMDFYPGEGYVDYFAISYWGEGGVSGQGTDASRAQYQLGVRKMLTDAQAMGLPLMISESTPAFIGTTSGEKSVQWFEDYFDLIEQFDIRIISYIATEWFDEGGNWGSPVFNGFFPPDARIHADPTVKAEWLRRLSNPRYVTASNANVPAFLKFKRTAYKLPWVGQPTPPRDKMRWPNCPFPLTPGTGGWCLPAVD